MKKTGQEKGITLIALIISIVILLILAAVTINAITGDGIISKATKAEDNYKSKADEEASLLDSYLAKIEEIEGSAYESATQVTDDNGTKFWVPEGYSVVRVNDKVAVNEGAVIQDESGNQWVWVPATVSEISEVVNGKNVGKLYSFTTTGATARTYSTTGLHEVDVITNTSMSTEPDENMREQLQAEFDSMLKSVKKYGGYYIARFEMGGTLENPVVQRYSTVLDKKHWENMYNAAKKLASNDSVTTGMIWGCQWDNTLRWLVSSGNKTWAEIKNSIYWGNFTESVYDFEQETTQWVDGYWDYNMINQYDNSYGMWVEGYYENVVTPGKDNREDFPDDLGKVTETGHSDMWKAGNIYDLAGNAAEITLTTMNMWWGIGYVTRGSAVSEEGLDYWYTGNGVDYIDESGYGTTRATLIINVD